MKRYSRIMISLMMLIVIGIMPAHNAWATPIDMGHGAGCKHTHISSCYHSHSTSCYTTYKHRHDSSFRVSGMWSCEYCNATNDTSGTGYRCNNCGRTDNEWTCYYCGKSNYTGTSVGSVCKKVLTCTQSTTDPLCGKDLYGDCVMPTVSYDLDPNRMEWTNNDVVVNYTGTESGSLIFTESGTQELTITSSSGHQIKDLIGVMRIDKVAPELPVFTINGARQ